MKNCHTNHAITSFLVIILVFSGIVRADSDKQTAAVEQEVVEWMRANAVPISSASSPTIKELSAFSNAFCSSRLVLLGEGTHGTREFFLMKSSIVAHLIEQCGFQNLGMEYDLVDSLPVQEFIQTGEGVPEAALDQQRGWVWNTEEVLAMVGWLKEYNRRTGRKVNYVGIDMLEIVRPLIYSLRYLRSHDVKEVTEIERILRSVLGKEVYEFENDKNAFYEIVTGEAPLENSYRLKETMALLVDLYDLHKERLTEATSVTDWEINRRIALTAHQKSKHLLQWNMNNIFPTYGRKEQNRIYSKAKETSSSLDEFYRAHDPSQHEELGLALELISNPYRGTQKYAGLSIEERGKIHDAVISSIERLKIRRFMYLRDMSEIQLARIGNELESLRMILETFKDYIAKPALSTNEREIGLFENVEWLTRSTVGRTIVWAHNEHVSMHPGRESDSMGSLLKREFRDDMFVIGTTFNKGRFQAAFSAQQTNADTSKLREFEVGEAKAGSLESLMARVGIPIFFIDFNKLPKEGPIHDWFSEERLVRSVGNSYNPEKPDAYYVSIVIPKHFDAMIFVNETERARPTKAVIAKYNISEAK